MNWLKTASSVAKNMYLIFTFAALSIIAACGGSDSGFVEPEPEVPIVNVINVAVSISNTEVNAANSATITAVVTDNNGALSGKLVTFTTTLGVLSPASATALTDSSGVASLQLQAGNIAGAGEVTATIDSSESGKIGFNTAGDAGEPGSSITVSLELVSANTGLTTQTVTSSTPAKVIATVSGISSTVIVTFNTDVGSIPIPTAITNGSNQATVDLFAANTLGAGTVTATVSSGEFNSLVYVVGATNLRMGSGTPFVEGAASIGTAQISAGGTTTVVVSVIDENGQLFNDPVEVNFSSSCTSATPATATLSSPVNTINGTASSTYLAQGCVGDDVITVSANAGGINLSASGTVNILSADVGSIEFISATPENIAIRGAGGVGGSESSILVFKVRDTNGNPVNGQRVNFSLNTETGGININPDFADTNSQGLVQTIVNSGTVAASVRITASIDGSVPLIATQSNNLVVSTGIPDQDSFTLSATTLNVEAWDIANAQTTISAFLADGFNNPVPEGTSVSLQTEGGKIVGSCLTDVNSTCSVIWNSQNPRPDGAVHSKTLFYRGADGDLGPSASNLIFLSDGTTANPSSLGQPYGGRVTVTGTAIGEESFPDLNGNGRFDASELATFLGNNTSGLPYDLREAFTDYNEDGFYNPDNRDDDASSGGNDNSDNEQAAGNLEELIDFNSNGIHDSEDSQYNGVLCSIPSHAGCSSHTGNSDQKSLHVRRNMTLIMSGSTPYIKVENPASGQISLAPEETFSGYIVISDLHNQPLPEGTEISFDTTVGSIKFGGGTWGNDNHNGGGIYSFTMEAPDEDKAGILSVKASFPSGASIEIGIIGVTVTTPP